MQRISINNKVFGLRCFFLLQENF